MITSNRLSKDEIRAYIQYLSEKYEKLWVLWTQGLVALPVISKSDVEILFDIIISEDNHAGMKPNLNSGFDVDCPVSSIVYNKNQLKTIGEEFNLVGLDSFKDLLVAHDLCLYNKSLIEDLFIV